MIRVGQGCTTCALFGGEIAVYRTKVTSRLQLVSKILIRSELSPKGKKNKQLGFRPVCWLVFITSWWCAGWQAVDRSKAARQPWLVAPGRPADTIQRWVAGRSAAVAAVAAVGQRPAGRKR